MFLVRVLLLPVLLLGGRAPATRISYSARYMKGNEIGRTSKLTIIPDNKVQDVVQNMRAWSNNRYDARISAHNIIIISNIDPAISKGSASTQVMEMQSIVNQHIIY
ncbi:hypothetical protein K445DRAFT_15665 [Daldinia sp. EC12]|nr:hypothetical protein K445DRAFT_15665 [Daldinia sp. EC12]